MTSPDAGRIEDDLTPAARKRIAKDWLSWKTEHIELSCGEEYTFEEMRSDLAELYARSDTGLIAWWFTTVGEWLCSRGDLEMEPDPDTWLIEQLESLMKGDGVDYGYVRPVKSIPDPDDEILPDIE